MVRPYRVDENPEDGELLVPLASSEKLYQEDWLQRLIHSHPGILPVESIDERYAPAVSIGREIANIDNLFVSPRGEITLVETKLWRNPEAHRTVIAQVLDYTSRLVSWSYDDLDQKVRASGSNPEKASMFKIVKQFCPEHELDETEFRANVTTCLQDGSFNLMVVGDRIRPEATQLAELIQTKPGLHYTLSFVELSCFQLSANQEWPLLVVPTIVQKTKEITRAVVKVIYEDKKPETDVMAIEDPKDTVSSSKTNMEVLLNSVPSQYSDLLKRFILSWTDKGFTVFWGVKGFSLRLNLDGKLKTVFDAYPDSVSVLSPKMETNLNLPDEIREQYRGRLLQVGAFGSALGRGGRYVGYESLKDITELELLLDATDTLADQLVENSK